MISPVVKAFVIAKNEEKNIERTLSALLKHSLSVIVLDSGSTDRTIALAAAMSGVAVESYRYVDHCTTYNEISLRTAPSELALILDADMIVTAQLWHEICYLLEQSKLEVIISPIEMWWEGKPLVSGSLCPPKAIVLLGGRAHFVASGHGERLISHPDRQVLTINKLIHDDRKGFESFLQSQMRYAQTLIDRAQRGETTRRDWMYLYTPAVLFLQPLYSYIFRGGFRSGMAGIIYALDRSIAAAIVLRQSLARRLHREKFK